MIVRPVRNSDLPALIELARSTGTGLTTLPANEERLLHRVTWAEKTFRGEAERGDADYLFVLENDDGKVVGISAIAGAVGLREPWYNFRVGLTVSASQELNIYREIPTLFLANDLTGNSELCSLFLSADYRTGLKAIIAIHSTRLGPALGGCRYLAYPDDESAVADAIRLSQDMSYKAALAGLAAGGGQAVIMRAAHVESRAALFEAFGRCVEQLSGRYITTIDSGTSTADMDCIAQHTQHVSGTTAAGDPSPHAAMGVFAGIRSTASSRLGSDNLEGLRVAIQGLGKVGFALAEQLHAAGAELLVSDTDPGKVRLAMEQLGAHPIACEALLSTPCDILAPCGLGGVLNWHSVAQLRCSAVAGCANNQLTNLQVADQLERRGILYAPDYVINSGGLIFMALTHQGAQPEAINQQLLRISERLTGIYAHAQAEKRSPARVSDELAQRLLYS